ncbi:MAG: hypothetical protein D6713_06510 [Deltaproteobacteria bacterium]|nr:MAG: hypothetical protein D6713_06510 [Deltaproteobacteria bacterium]
MERELLKKVFILLTLILACAIVAPREGHSLTVTISGSVLRVSSGKFVISLGEFELGGARQVEILDRETGETTTVDLSSVYEDISYSSPLPEDLSGKFRPGRFICRVTRQVEDTREALEEFLTQVHEFENRLRRSLGKEATAPGTYVSSRLVLGKIQKFHRIAAKVVAKLYEKGQEEDRYELFTHPVRFELEFSPDVEKAFGGNAKGLALATRGLLYDEFERTFVQEFQLTPQEAELLYILPSTVKNFVVSDSGEGSVSFVPFPYIEVSPEGLNALWYIHRQGLAPLLLRKINAGKPFDPVITDRDIVRKAVSLTRVIGKEGDSLFISAGTPFVKPGIRVRARHEGGEVSISVDRVPSREYSVGKASPPETTSRIDEKWEVILFPRKEE